MENAHLSQIVNWLDEEQRKNKAEVLRLQQRAESQEAELTEQIRRSKALEAQVAGIQAQLSQIHQLEQALEQLKSEVVLLINKSEERQRQAEREADRKRQSDQESLSRAISELKKELEKYRYVDDNFSMLRAEDRRLGEIVQKIQQEVVELRKQSDAPGHSIAFLEEQRRHDARRITELQVQVAEALKRSEGHGAKILIVEESSKRNETNISGAQRLINDLKQEQAHILENVQLREQARQRQMTDWEQEIVSFKKVMEEYQARMQVYAEQYGRINKSSEDLQEFKQRLEREQHQVIELQRLSEDRQKAQSQEWQQEQEKKRQEHQLRLDQQLADHIKRTEVRVDEIAALHEKIKGQDRLIALLWQVQEEMIQHQVNASREWQLRFEELAE